MRKFAIVAVLIAGLATPAFAGPATVKFVAGPYQGEAGEFTFQIISGLSGTGAYVPGVTANLVSPPSFQTFCIETTEGINLGTYDAVQNPDGAVNGGFGGPNPDPISVGTGYLYSQFASGILAGYDYADLGIGRIASANLLQQAIWWLENENPLVYNQLGNLNANPFYLAVVGLFADPRAGDGTTDYGVYALNLWKLDGTARQDVLYIPAVPDGGATLMMLGGALIGIGALRRKVRR